MNKTQKFKLPLVLTTAFFVLSLTQCGKDEPPPPPCQNVTCNNDGTVTANCECDCPCWFTGATCDGEKTPARIDIDKIVVTRFPAGNGGTSWDPTCGNISPDLKVIVYRECSPGPWCAIFTSTDVKTNALPGQSYTFQLPATSLSKPLEKYRVSLYDEDPTEDVLMGGKTFTPYTAGEKFPNPIKVTSGDVDFELYVKYYFDAGCVKSQ